MTWNPCYQGVQCRTCKDRFICTPSSDYYGSTCATDGQCERCMLTDAGLTQIVDIDTSGRILAERTYETEGN